MALILPAQHQRLVLALEQCEEQLHRWTDESEANSRLFSEDPAAALEAADLRLDLDTMVELETVLRGLARKLELSSDRRPAP
jgi:hypothetical protein